MKKLSQEILLSLKNGGPAKTVHSSPANGKIVCYYFDHNELKKEEFKRSMLKTLAKKILFSTNYGQLGIKKTATTALSACYGSL